jgi:MurNAc alpha-1-phosphate uridylyltransferase
MRPLTDELPKPLVRFNGRALLDHVLDRLSEGGFEEAIVNVHYLADLIEAHLVGRSRPKIRISDERGRLLDTGGGVTAALPLLGEAPFLIHNSDSVWLEGVGSSLGRLVDSWDGDRMDSLMLMAPIARSLGYDGRGDFYLDGDGLVSRRRPGEFAPFVFTGVSIAHPRMFNDAPDGAFSLNKLWDKAIEAGRLYGVRLDGIWMHIGTPEALTDAERFIAGEQQG